MIRTEQAMVPHYKLPRGQCNTTAEQIGHYSERTSVWTKMPTLWHSQALIFFLCLCSALFTSCGGSSSNPPPPAQDFTLSVSTAEIVTTAGTVSPPFSVSITGKNGFRDSASVTLSGLPSGATSQPASPFTVAAGQSQAVTVSVPASLGLGSFTVQVDATSGSVSHQGQVIFVLMVIKTFDTGTMLQLETDTASETSRVGLLKDWGGSIAEVSLNGTDYVNNDDPGRQIQTSLWDGNANYITSWGYNPIEAGDHFFHGSPLLANTLLPDSIYTKTQPIQWAPENFGGGTDSVLGDAYIEKWISVVPSYNRVFKVHYRITHFGTDSHAQNLQELPVAYVNPNTPHFLYYGGTNPWTNGALTPFDVQGPCCDHVHTPEKWGAYVDSTNIGLALYTPMQFPHSQVFNAVFNLAIDAALSFQLGAEHGVGVRHVYSCRARGPKPRRNLCDPQSTVGIKSTTAVGRPRLPDER